MRELLEREILENWDQLNRLVWHILKDPTVTEDAMQSAFVKAVTTPSQPNAPSKILPWFKTILKRTALDILRQQKRTIQGISEEEFDTMLGHKDIEESVCECISSLMGKLSYTDQKLLTALDIEAQSLEEVSEQIGVTKNTLKTRAHRARKRLKSLVQTACKIGSNEQCQDCECR